MLSKMKKILFSLALGFLIDMAYAQQEASNWYFGENAGIHFEQDGTVTTLNTGQLNTREGCASISDQDGQLLFYTDGSTVFNRVHNVMANGSGLFGDASSTQSAIIVPRPNTPNIYYIFTVDNSVDGSNFGLNYSEVDMSLFGGLGAVTNKNVNLLPLCSEKITAVLKDCVDRSLWVVTFASFNGTSPANDTFHAFEVNAMGVSTTSVTSQFPGLNITDQRGYLKLSPDGTKLANANMDGVMGSGLSNDVLHLYDFDTQTGMVSNQQPLAITTGSNSPYGVEFSPNNRFLYVHSSNNFFDNSGPDLASNHLSTLTQFDLEAVDIQASEFTIEERQLYRGGLQLGPDGKIYRALSVTYSDGLPFLGVINNPNEPGAACNYIHNAINLSPNSSTQGLPPFEQSIFNQKIDIIQNGEGFSTYLPLCDGDTYTLVAEATPGANYTWSFEGTILPETDFDLEIDQPGHYEVYIDFNNGNCDTLEGEAFVDYFVNPTALDTTLFQCDQDGTPDGLTLFNLSEASLDLANGEAGMQVRFFPTLQDLQDETNELDASFYENTSNPETIFALVINPDTQCRSSSQLTLEVSTTQIGDYTFTDCDELDSEDGLNTFDLNSISNTMLTGLPNSIELSFYTSYDDALLEQNALSGTYQNTTPYSELLFVRAETQNACYGIGEVTLQVRPRPQLLEDNSIYYCLNFFPNTITLESGNLDSTNFNNYTYLWSTGEQTESIEVNQIGDYTVTVTDLNGCEKSRTITVEASNLATIDTITVIDGSLSYANTVTVNVSGEGTYEYALFNALGAYRHYQDSNVFEQVIPGFYTVYVRDVKNNCGIAEQLISVIGFPKFFTPNNDGYQDTWQVYGLSEQFQSGSKILIFDRYGKLLKQLDPAGTGWDGTFNGYPMPTSDYWFAVTLADGRIFKSHFSLKR